MLRLPLITLAVSFALAALPAQAQEDTQARPENPPAVGDFSALGKPSSTPPKEETGPGPSISQEAPDFEATDITGRKFKLSDYVGRTVVLEWTNAECPFVVWHYGSGNMQNLQSYAGQEGAVWITVNSSAQGREGHMTVAEVKDYLEKMRALPTHYVIDDSGTIGRMYGAKTTPHMFVVDDEGKMAYMGAIDDQPIASPRDNDKAVNYVRNAIASLSEGYPVEIASTQAYGCSVKYAKN